MRSGKWAELPVLASTLHCIHTDTPRCTPRVAQQVPVRTSLSDGDVLGFLGDDPLFQKSVPILQHRLAALCAVHDQCRPTMAHELEILDVVCCHTVVCRAVHVHQVTSHGMVHVVELVDRLLGVPPQDCEAVRVSFAQVLESKVGVLVRPNIKRVDEGLGCRLEKRQSGVARIEARLADGLNFPLSDEVSVELPLLFELPSMLLHDLGAVVHDVLRQFEVLVDKMRVCPVHEEDLQQANESK
mmetsp:Transcript_43228/g.101723  ORF Transcript_43228/g.101723 Transcript_43228/m.101723 type:complete len:242 (-) Transcript_43228:102-827(-)